MGFTMIRSISLLTVLLLGALAAACEGDAQGCKANSDCGDGTCCLIACLASELQYPAAGTCGEECSVSLDCAEGLKCFSADDDGCEDKTGMCADETEQSESQLCE